MMRWSLEFTKEAESDLAGLGHPLRRRIIDKLDWFVKNFDRVIPLTLSGEYKEFFKLRAGDWRIVYQVDWKKTVITICYIDRRDKIYKRR